MRLKTKIPAWSQSFSESAPLNQAKNTRYRLLTTEQQIICLNKSLFAPEYISFYIYFSLEKGINVKMAKMMWVGGGIACYNAMTLV